MRLYYQPKGYWFGDCMPFGKGDTFYLFHQRDTRKPCPFGEPFGWDLATTKDFVTYEDCGTIEPGGVRLASQEWSAVITVIRTIWATIFQRVSVFSQYLAHFHRLLFRNRTRQVFQVAVSQRSRQRLS